MENASYANKTITDTPNYMENTTDVDIANLCTQFNVAGNNCHILIYCKRVSASLSIVGCLFTITILLFYKRNQQFTQRLILNLSIAALLEAVGFFLVDIPEATDLRCSIQAVWLLFSLWAILLWVLFITLNIIIKIIMSNTLKGFELIISFGCWGIPGIITCIAVIAEVYGPTGPWCWLPKEQFNWKIGLWYAWAVTSLVVVTILVIVKKCLKGTKAIEGSLYNYFHRRQKLIPDIHILRAFHSVFFIAVLILFPIVNDIYFEVYGEYNFTLYLLQTITVPSIGAAVTLSFLSDKSTRYVLHPKVIAEALRRRFTILDELWNQKDRAQSCDTFLTDIFVSSTSVDTTRENEAHEMRPREDVNVRDSGFMSLDSKRETLDSLGVITEEWGHCVRETDINTDNRTAIEDGVEQDKDKLNVDRDSDEGIYEMPLEELHHVEINHETDRRTEDNDEQL